MMNYRGRQMNEIEYWKKVFNVWSYPVDPEEKRKQKDFIDKLPDDFGKINPKLISDDLDEIDDDDW